MSASSPVSPALTAARPPAAQAALVAHVRARLRCAGGSALLRETHTAWVLLTDDRAFKIKKAIRLPFLDYSALAQRRAACMQEVRINEELAPDVYIGVAAVTGAAEAPRLVDLADAPSGVEPLDYAVVMRRFGERDTLDGRIAEGALTAADITRSARRIAEFHRAAPPVAGGRAEDVGELWRRNVEDLGAALEQSNDSYVELTDHFARAFMAAHRCEIDARADAGLVRDGHGDLRCEHVVLWPSLQIVDRLEFDSALRATDVASDLAFLVMDLHTRGEPQAAAALVREYRDAGGDCGSDALLAFYATYRALVRAKVAAVWARAEPSLHAAKATEAAKLLDLAAHLAWRARLPLALVICGSAASGKTSLARRLATTSGLPVVSSDVVRKELAGIGPTERAAQAHYSDEFTRATYRELGRRAAQAYQRSRGVIIDATCRRRSERSALREGLGRAVAEPVFVQCRVSPEVASARARLRLRDPDRISDAPPQLADAQARSLEPLHDVPRDGLVTLDADRDLADLEMDLTAGIDYLLQRRHAANRG